MVIKDLSKKDLKRYQDLLKLFEFFGITESDIASIPTLKAQIKQLQEEVETLKIEKLNAKKKKELEMSNRGFSGEDIIQAFFSTPKGLDK